MSIALLVRRCLHLLASTPILLPLLSPAPAAAQATQETISLQRRLTDARCYAGPLDGVISNEVMDAVRQCPDSEPVLTIETGMHVAGIKGIAVDADCRLAVTGSDDKTVRLWSLPDGKLLRTLRWPIGSGSNGKVFAVAVSPDGRTVAAGGYDAHAERSETGGVYLFDAASGAMTARFGSFDDVVNHLAFSPDGRRLAVLLGGSNGLRVLDAQSGSEIAADKDYDGTATSAAFGPDGRLFTGSVDGYLRSYGADFKLASKIATAAGNEPVGVAVDASGAKLAVAMGDTMGVEVHRTSDLGLTDKINTSALAPGRLVSVAWSKDGSRLVAGGSFQRLSDFVLVVWEDGGRGRRSETNLARDTITSLASCGEGFVAASLQPSWARLDAGGQIAQNTTGAVIDMQGKLDDAFQVSHDGSTVAFGMDYGATRPAVFDLDKGTLTPDAKPEGLAAPKVQGLQLSGWQNGFEPRLGSASLALPSGSERTRSLAIAPDASQFVLGTDWTLRSFDRDGQEQWSRPAPATAWGVNVTGDGRLVVAAYGDGTIRWHRMSDGEELLALFVDKDDRRWVAWTPSGYYQASAGGEDLFGWHVNRGWNQAADFFPASRFRHRFNRPDVVQKILLTLDEANAIEEANREANLRADPTSAASRLPPVVRIVSPPPGAPADRGEVTIEYELRSPSGLPVDSIEVQVDGRLADAFQRTETGVDGTQVERRTIAIPPRDVTVGIVARAGLRASDVASVQLKWTGAAPGADDQIKPKLYGLLVGAGSFKDPAINLRYAAKDAKDLAEALMAQNGGLYRDVELKVLTDAEATMAEVKKGLTWLERSVTSRDVGLLFFAGHGITDVKNRYYFLTSDSDFREMEDTALEGITLKERTRAIAGKVLVFLDTGHAGQAVKGETGGVADMNTLVNELSSTENGVVVYASSTGRQLSQENESLNNGAFAKALIEGLPAADRKGSADVANKGVITTATLDAWLAARVKELTGGAQSPVMIRPPTISDFPVFAAVK
jgi:WD40 repeat protein